MSHFSFDIDPLKVLGIRADAPLDEIREAYRLKAKKFHPDAGGEDWAFRILVQSYEWLCSERVVRATRVEAPARPSRGPAHRPEPKSETVHAGIHDKDIDPSRIVAVEHFCIRYLWDEADYLWLGQRAPEEERFLSCNLNLSWPDTSGSEAEKSAPADPAMVQLLSEIFDHMIIATRVVTSRSRVDQDRFGGWLSYSGFDRSWKAVNTLHRSLRSRGLGMRQWSRDLFIPRSWR